MQRLHLCVLAVATVAAACSTLGSGSTPFELGAAEFPSGDAIVIQEVSSTTGDFSPGAVVTVRGRYSLVSRGTGHLYLGTTTREPVPGRRDSPTEQVTVQRGAGQFELQHEVPAPGFLHVTFYDPQTHQPFGGQYFGKGDSLLVAKSWAYSR